ncbi:MAG: hypothetical protein D6712_17780 [Chloroflexi bacterium]|nr:MAG: hypothetical protein D6712_17780 [Chloroflexota bacterium]
MAFSEEIKSQAFEWYVEGFTDPQIVLNFQAQGIRISKATIGDWRKKEDWKTRKDAIHARRREQLDDKLVDSLSGHTEKLIAIADKIAAKLETVDFTFNTLDEATKVYVRVLDRAMKLSQPEKVQVVKKYIQNNLVVIFDDYNQILESDAVLGELFRSRKKLVMERLMEKQAMKVLDD